MQQIADGFYASGMGTIEGLQLYNRSTGVTWTQPLITSTGGVNVAQAVYPLENLGPTMCACKLFAAQDCRVTFGSKQFDLAAGEMRRLIAPPARGFIGGDTHFFLSVPEGTYQFSEAQVVNVENEKDMPPFASRPYMQELDLCRKYYRVIPYTKVGTCISTSAFMLDAGLYTDMRAAPAVRIFGKTGVENSANHGAAQTLVTGILKSQDLTNPYIIQFNKSGLTLGNQVFASLILDASLTPSMPMGLLD